MGPDVESESIVTTHWLRDRHGKVECGRCGRRLGYALADAVVPDLRRDPRLDPDDGDLMSSTPGLRSGFDYELRDGQHRFVCRSGVCRSATRGRGTLSYLDRLPEPGETARTRLP